MIPRRIHPRFRADAGMTLFECLCAIAVLAILASVLSQTFISTTRLSAAANGALDRVRQAAEIRDAFSAAVREAGRVTEGVLEYKTGADCLVLQLSPVPGTAARRYAVLRRMEDGRFTRLDLEERDGALATTYFKTYALRTMGIKFTVPESGRLVNMQMDLLNAAQSPNRPPVVYRYTAAMRSVLGGEGQA